MAGAQYGLLGRRVGDPDEAVGPSFSMIAARSTDPTVGAAVWASGSQVWRGHIGTLTAAEEHREEDQEGEPPGERPRGASSVSCGMSKVRSPDSPDWK